MTNISNFLDSHLKRMAHEFEVKKMELIREAIKQKLGLYVNIEDEMTRRFPRIVIISSGTNATSVYWNDGTTTGLRLITFNFSQEIDYEKNKVSINLNHVL